MENNEYRTLDNNNQNDKLIEAYIMWGKATVDLYDIIKTMYKQVMKLDEVDMIKQVIEMAYAATLDRADDESIEKMRKFIKDNILIPENEEE